MAPVSPLAHHDPAVLTADLAVVMRLHPAVPMLTVADLAREVKSPGPVRRAALHVWDCSICGDAGLCPTGLTLAAKIQPPSRKRTRGWATLRDADVAQAQARKEGGSR
jgi:hypothetical protein